VTIIVNLSPLVRRYTSYSGDRRRNLPNSTKAVIVFVEVSRRKALRNQIAIYDTGLLDKLHGLGAEPAATVGPTHLL